MKNQKFLVSLIVSIVILGLAIPAAFAMAQGGIDQNFNPSLLIRDEVFTDTKTFGDASGIQKFLEKKGSVLANTSPDFLVKLREPSFTDLKIKLEDPQPNLGRLRTAAELIWDASRQSGLNPQVFIVKLQKEQGLITNDPKDKLQRALDAALGFGCPDGGGCNQILAGFYFQLFGAVDASGDRYLGAGKSLIRAFNIPIGNPVISLGGKVGRVGEVFEFTNTQDPYGVPATQQVLLSNRATAALYRYTPHVFNGNYNFWKFFNEWFKYPNGTIMQVGGNPQKYIIQNGSRFLLPDFTAKARALNLSDIITVSQTEVESYPAEKDPLGPLDNTIVVSEDGKKYVFVGNIKHPASDLVIRQRKLDPAKALTANTSELALFSEGPQLTPSDGTILRGVTDKAVYLVEKGKLLAFSDFTFKQRKISARQVVIIPDAEVASYAKAGFVTPLDGTVVKSDKSPAVYEILQGERRVFSAELFKNRGLLPRQIAVLSQGEVDGLALSEKSPLPKDKTFYVVKETGEQYYFRSGETKRLLPLVIRQQKITPDFIFAQNEHNSWATGSPVAPRENTVIQAEGDATIYLVSGKKLRPLTFDAFKRRKITTKQIVRLPKAEVDFYEKGEVLSR